MISVMVESLPMIEMGWGDAGLIALTLPAIRLHLGLGNGRDAMGERKTG